MEETLKCILLTSLSDATLDEAYGGVECHNLYEDAKSAARLLWLQQNKSCLEDTTIIDCQAERFIDKKESKYWSCIQEEDCDYNTFIDCQIGISIVETQKESFICKPIIASVR